MIDEPQDQETPETPDEEIDAAEAADGPATGEVVETPVDPPVDVPVDPQVDAPVDPPLEVPVDPPLEVPVDPPVDAPVDPPVDKPAAEKKPAEKKDVIPGADLEPIAVEPEAKPLSAEEQARLEAEEEERARREAELAAAEETPASRAPAKIEAGKRFIATGKRKRSIARVTIVPGDGKFEVNKRDLAEFFPRPLHQTIARQPLAAAGYEGNVDVRVRVHGGGISGQAGAVRHGIARALTEVDPELRGDLKRRGFLTRDARVKERRKAGFKKARKKPQFSKR